MAVTGRPRFAWLRCGTCKRQFGANADAVPVFFNQPCCRECWDTRNRMRAAIGLPANDRPLCYVEDYPLVVEQRAAEGKANPAAKPPPVIVHPPAL